MNNQSFDIEYNDINLLVKGFYHKANANSYGEDDGNYEIFEIYTVEIEDLGIEVKELLSSKVLSYIENEVLEQINEY